MAALASTLRTYRLELVAGGSFALVCAALFRFTAEDAFIVQRYASQIVRGHGLVFNIGERVSALTSPLHALLLTALAPLPSPMFAYKVIGAAAALASILYAARQLFEDTYARRTFLTATLGSPFVAMWSVGGLETPLLLACITVLSVLALRPGQNGLSKSEVTAFLLLAGVAFLLRHDSVTWCAPFVLAVVYRFRRQSIPGLLAGCGLVAAWAVFAWLYYGDIVPTSFHAKIIGMRPPLLGGAGYLLSFLVLCLLPVSFLRWRRGRNLPLAAWISVVLFFVLAAVVGHVHMMFGYRFYVPFIPALVAFSMRLAQPSVGLSRWAFVPPLAVNLALLLIVHSYTVNPTLFHPALFEPHYGFLSRMAKRGFAYEYTREGAAAYGDFIAALRRTGRAIAEDAEARQISRSASLATIIAGATPNEIPDIYVYDNLVGVRRNCPTLERQETYRAADYIQFMVPRFGRLDTQLGGLKSTAILVSEVEFEFDGRKERLYAYFNPLALHTPVPKKLHDPCPPGRR
jgi:arabinofuranosyltransferase